MLLPSSIWRKVLRFRQQHAGLDAPLFPSRRGAGYFHPTSIERVVRKAAQRAGPELAVSPTLAAPQSAEEPAQVEEQPGQLISSTKGMHVGRVTRRVGARTR